jgi:hypothetical protein
MNPSKTNRSTTVALTDLPNIGPAIANDLVVIGIYTPTDLVGADAVALYELLNEKTGQRHDPCVLDVFMSAIEFMNGKKAKAWWQYTASRKAILAKRYSQ